MNIEFKGTPGPWDAVWISGAVDIFRRYPDGSGRYSPLAKVKDFLGDFENTAANAALVKSAPTLLSALADCLLEMETYSHVGHPGGEKGAAEFNVRFNFAKAALREALGEQP